MDNQESRPNKAEAIRRALTQLGRHATYRVVRDHLKMDGIADVRPQEVSNQKKRLAKLGDEDSRASVLMKVKALVDEVGSIAALRRAIDDLEKLRK
jgi:hypothetical protein